MKAISLGPATGRMTRVSPNARRRGLAPRLRQGLSSVGALLQEWRRRGRSRAELAKLDDRMLRDIGITRGDVWREINKPFWRS
jgi:uncharacterized protein YjiS (DUF1127 family)